MRTLLASLAVAAVVVVPACVPFGCGAYSGAGDQVYARGTDQLIVCENGGFVATVDAGTIEGRIVGDQAIRGDDGQLAFDVQDNADSTLTTPQLGDTPWVLQALDQTALDHADVRCTDLESRSWWTTQP